MTFSAPAVHARSTIRWRLQTYASPALAAHVVKPAVDAFNQAANGEMEIELFYADQFVPTGDLFRAMQDGTIDAVQSDDDSMAAPTDVAVFGGYFPLALRYSLDVPVLFSQYGLGEIWDKAYEEVGVKWISAGAWIGHFFANRDRWNELPDHLKTLWRLATDASHYYRQYWYWGGEAQLRTQGGKMELTSIPEDEWARVEAEAARFWDEIASTSDRAAKIVGIFRQYNEVMSKAGRPYR